MLLATGGTAGEMGTKSGDGRVGVPAGQLELDITIELVEALVAADLRFGRAEQPLERLLRVGSVHEFLSSSRSSSASPRSARCPRSFRRASCRDL